MKHLTTERVIADLYEAFADDWGGAEAWPALFALVDGVDVGGKRWLDVACGTGRFVSEVVARGWDVRGVDLSAAMVDVARERVGGVAFDVGDMTTLAMGETFDVVTCMGGSVNTLSDPAVMRVAISRMADHVAAGGVMVVDVNTPAGLAGWDEWGMADPEAKRPFIIEGSYDAGASEAVWAVSVFVPTGGERQYERFDDTITQRAVDEDELAAWLGELGGEVAIVDAYDGGEPSVATTRVFGVWRRED